MFMAGAPSHLELFDPKPELQKRDGQLPPADLLKDYRAAFINPNSALLGPKYKFSPHGKSGIEFSELIANIAGLADDLDAILRLKRERNAVVLAHNYQTPEIFHGVADIVGDSLALAREAAKSDADVIVVCGVHFMAETAKLLNPAKKVIAQIGRAHV